MADATDTEARAPRRIHFVDERHGIAFDMEVPPTSRWWGLTQGATARIVHDDEPGTEASA